MIRRIAGGAFLLVIFAVAMWWHSTGRWHASSAEADDIEDGSPPGATTAPTSEPAADSAHEGAADTGGRTTSDAEARRRIAEGFRRAILDARDERLAADGEDDELADWTEPELGSDEHHRPGFMFDATTAVMPLVSECYQLAIAAAEREHRDKPLGLIRVRVDVVGEPELGGMVEEVTVLEDSTLRDPVLVECVTETLFTLELPAPSEPSSGSTVLPMTFAESEPEREPLRPLSDFTPEEIRQRAREWVEMSPEEKAERMREDARRPIRWDDEF